MPLPYSFTAPAATPWTMYFWATRKMIITGMIITNPPNDGHGRVQSRTAIAIVNGIQVFLPAIGR
jgi:hypothetical protein